MIDEVGVEPAGEREVGVIDGALVFWFVATTIRYLFFTEIDDACLMPVTDPLLAIFGVYLIIRHGVLRGPSRRDLAVVVAIVVFIAGWFNWGRDLGITSRFLRSRSEYEDIVARYRGDPELEALYPVDVDRSGPTRVAISWGGFLDNWGGMVHDPTGEVMRANEIVIDGDNWNDPDLLLIRDLFGGKLVYARHIWGDWYYCGFT